MSVSPIHIIIVLVLGVLFFGKNLPAVAKQIGSSLLEFRKGLDEWRELRPGVPNAGKSKSVAAGAVPTEEEPVERFEMLGTKFEPPPSEGSGENIVSS